MKAAIAIIVTLLLVAAGAAVFFLWEKGAEADEELESVIEVSDDGRTTVNKGLRFNGESSRGAIISYLWDFGDGTTSSKENPTHTYDQPGRYSVSLTVKDDEGNERISYTIVYVNSPPIAAFSVSDTTPQVYQTISFRGDESVDKDGSIEQYLWDFGDGSDADTAEAQHAYDDPGKYRVRLTVRDSYDAEDVAELELQVTLRTFQVGWTVENKTETVQNTTREYAHENLTFPQLDRDNLVYVSFHLTWDDRQPINVVSEGNDNFTLTVWPPGSSARNLSSEYESILFEWDLAAVPAGFTLPARTMADARDSIDMDEYETSEGRGVWDAQVALGEAGDGLLQDGGYMVDDNNSWRLDVTYQYYVMTLSEDEE